MEGRIYSRGMAERAFVDFQRGGRARVTTSEEHVLLLKRDKIIEIRRFGSSKEFLSKRKFVL